MRSFYEFGILPFLLLILTLVGLRNYRLLALEPQMLDPLADSTDCHLRTICRHRR